VMSYTSDLMSKGLTKQALKGKIRLLRKYKAT